MKNKFNYDKCIKPEKQMFHDICIHRGLINPKCRIDNKKCVAYTGKLYIKS